MKLRESGMPEETWWETLVDAELTLSALGLTGLQGDVVELGCGYGTFTCAVAGRTAGVVCTFDIEADMPRRRSPQPFRMQEGNSRHPTEVSADRGNLEPGIGVLQLR